MDRRSAPEASPWRRLRDMDPDVRDGILVGVVVVALTVLVLVLGATHPRTAIPPLDDRLGPDLGETGDQYLARAAEGLGAAGDDAPRWALISLSEGKDAGGVTALLGDAPGVRVAQVIVQVGEARAGIAPPAIPIVIPEPGTEAMRHDLLAAAIDQAVAAVDPGGSRGAGVVIGLVVRGAPPRLRTYAARDGVRAVQVLPADAVAGRFGVTPFPPDVS